MNTLGIFTQPSWTYGKYTTITYMLLMISVMYNSVLRLIDTV